MKSKFRVEDVGMKGWCFRFPLRVKQSFQFTHILTNHYYSLAEYFLPVQILQNLF